MCPISPAPRRPCSTRRTSAFGQPWHVPCAPTRTTREILQIAADALGVPLRTRTLPAPLLTPIGLFSPFLREMREMRFQWDRPYRVDASKFARTFWSDVTPFESGVRETALSFRKSAAADPLVSPAPATRR